ncbi:peptide-N4-(N-acetyl-beta-glucosaminyl)asparagine amidase A-like [Salvia divinorum]|uniref:Peptide-N4-(N-acetyl-beta-glucosaminyl)asparagine amidase A-like n=1 Tax=Salvia divinorum TaxID=28513 RepID=A0ABD1GKZ4_SALDI
MHLSLLLLSVLVVLPLSGASPPPFQHHPFPRTRRTASSQHPKLIEVTRPLPYDSLTPACSLPLFNHSFGNTYNLPPTAANYSAPLDCTWSNAVLQFSGASNGTQYDRISAVWLAGAELLRTSTPEPTPEGISWTFRKDITRYSALLRRSNLTLSVMLENIVDDFYTGIFHVNITFLFYNLRKSPLGNKSSPRKLVHNRQPSFTPTASLELDQIPADLIIPVSAAGAGEEGFWFRFQSENDAVYREIQIPSNTYRAVIEVYVSAHGDDEFWYSNPPDYYIERNGLNITRGHGVYREVLVKLDDSVVGSVLPFPVIFTGGINPLFWDPIVAIGAFSLPSYKIELTPFLGMLLDDKPHYFGFGVAEAIPFWLVDANLHLWLDDGPVHVSAGLIKYRNPNNRIQRESSFAKLDGKFRTVGQRDSEFSGWVYSSAGNLTTRVITKLQFDNEVSYKSNGTIVNVEHKVTVQKQIEITMPSSGTVATSSVDSKYPLKLKTTSAARSGPENYLMSTDLEVSYEEEKKMDHFESQMKNKQKCKGWMLVQGNDVLSGAGATSQTYTVKDSLSCYSRKISANESAVVSDAENFLCGSMGVSGSSDS